MAAHTMEEHSEQLQSARLDSVSRWILVGLSIVVAAAGLWRVVKGDDATLKRLDSITLTYFAVAAALLLLRDVKSLAFGDYKVEFERAKQIAADAKLAAENAQAVALGAGEGKSTRSHVSALPERRPGPVANDQWKGQFGNLSVRANRKLEATVTRLSDGVNPFAVRLTVSSTSPRTDPLQGSVQFFLHQTFKNDQPIVTVGNDGTAQLNLRAYGAFTVGALTDGGKNQLELDLADLPDAPIEFRAN